MIEVPENVPTETAACHKCKAAVVYLPPALRTDERILCLACATKDGTKAPAGATYIRVGLHPVERLAELHTERFEKRYGKLPPVSVVNAWKENMLKWPEGPKISGWTEGKNAWTFIADAMEKFKAENPVQWNRKHILNPNIADAFAKVGNDVLTMIEAKARGKR